MSQANVELMHRAMDAFKRRDLDAYLALIDPEVEFTPYEVWVQGGQPYRGHVGVRSWWKESFEVLPDFRVEVLGRGPRSSQAPGVGGVAGELGPVAAC